MTPFYILLLESQPHQLTSQSNSVSTTLIRSPVAIGTYSTDKVNTRVSSLSLVRYKNNDYSAPTRYGHQEVLAKGYVDRVEIVRRDATIAVHPRSYETADFIYNPLHYLALLEQKTKALDQAAPLDNWRLADCVHTDWPA